MPKTNFILSSYVEGHVIKKIKSELCVFGWFLDLQNLDVFLENLLWSKFSGRNNSLKSPVFGFYHSLPYDLD